MNEGRGRALMRTLRVWRSIEASYPKGRTLWELAHEFAVTPRTIRRDLQVLEEFYVPIIKADGDGDRARWGLLRKAGCPCCGLKVRA